MRTMRALSIRQPWSDAIMAGWKDVENRTWDTAHRGPLAVHSGLTLARLPRDLGGAPPPGGYLPSLTRQLAAADAAPGDRLTGHVLGTVQLVDTHPASSCSFLGVPWHRAMCSEWALPDPGPYAKRPDMFHWVLDDPRPIDPVMVSGALQLFAVELPD